jgi:chaperonin GroES
MATKSQLKIKPLGDRLLVQRLEAQTKTASGIYLPESATEKPQQAKVVAVGEGKVQESTGKRVKPDVKKGDTIILGKWGGTEIKIQDETYIVVESNEVLAVVD